MPKDSSAGIQLLNGVKVVEWASMVAGPSCGKLFADQGAEVVKLEPPEGDEARRRGPFARDYPGLDRSLLFLYLNTNKLGVTLKIERPTGKRILLDLIKQADIFIVDQPPAYLEELHLDYQHLKELNPGLIVTTITPFGWTGPYRDYKSYYLNAYHAGGDGYMLPGGQLAASLYRDREPIKAGGYIGEYQVGISAAAGTVSAFWERLDTGTGGHVDVSKQEAMMHLNSSDIALYPQRRARVASIQPHSALLGGDAPVQGRFLADEHPPGPSVAGNRGVHGQPRMGAKRGIRHSKGQAGPSRGDRA